jgi:tRNA-modifying protein YgfZ
MSDLPGAVPLPDDAPDAAGVPSSRRVAWHYGDPLGEQRQLEAGTGFVDRSDREVIRIAGPDRLTWLHTVTSQHLTQLPSQTWTQALVLSPHGHVEHHLFLVDDGEAVWAHVEPGTAADLIAYLDSMKFWSDVSIDDVTDAWAVVWQPGDPGSVFDSGRYSLVPRDELSSWATDHAPAAGLWAFEALRVAAGRARHLRETDHRTIPHEVGWIGVAVHLDKGCYRGQETVARVQNLGQPPRRLVLLHLDGAAGALPTPGDEVRLEERAVGIVTSVAQHHELGPVALAVVKRKVPADAALVVRTQAGEDVAAAQDDPVAHPAPA